MAMRISGRMVPQLAFVVWLLVFSISGFAQTNTRCPSPVADFFEVVGSVELESASGAVSIAAVKSNICPGDIVKVGKLSRTVIRMRESGRTIELDQETMLGFGESPTGAKLIDLIKGAIYATWQRLVLTARGEIPGLEFRTPVINGRVTGTEFLVQHNDQDGTLTAVFAGRIHLWNEQGSLNLVSGQSAVTLKGQAPQLRVVVRPRDAVQWTMYYQPVLPPALDPSLPKTPANQVLRESLEKFNLGNTTEAFDQLDQVPEADRDEHYYVYRAGLLLGVGRPDEAQADLDRALEISPKSGEAYAVKAVIAIAQNDREQALSDGHKAVELNPRSSAAKIALSYGLQADLRLEDARDVLLQAVEDQPDNSLAWARLSEIWLSLGYINEALECAQTAISVGPESSRAHSVLGFARLAQIKISQAKAAFEKAIAVEPGDPLARLGLGLAKIRDGDLSEGREDIEMAAVLDPNDSLIRSYLGKAYFEEKRDEMADEQFNLAKTLDPLDPTPYFYDAIRKQTVNRPVEALRDLQRSIELNDNRAVYRSRLLMDEDLAARSAGLGRIYRDLGFEQLALVEGWKSVIADPGNYSGHRFLADSYSALPRHEIARVSELLQSQLLQPINITPIQPQLAEDQLFILEGLGPSSPSFNEFNSIFTRNRITVQGNGVFGSNSTYGNDLVVAGIHGRHSFSVGQFHYETDGFRDNNDHDRDLYNAFYQGRLSYKTSIQAEYRYMVSQRGDLGLLFDPDDFDPESRGNDEFDTLRLGLHHVFSPRSKLIGSAYYKQSDRGEADSFTIPFLPGLSGSINRLRKDHGWTVEARHLFQSHRFRITSGLGTLRSDRSTAINLEAPPPLPSTSSFTEENVNQANLYVYSQIDYPRNVTLDLGVSADFYKRGEFLERNQVNPKLGITWSPRPETIFRASAFRTLHRAFVSDQTIEPTQVAGFNQLFDGIEAEDAWRFGVAGDQKFTQNLYGGLEISWRDLQVPILQHQPAPDPPSVVMFDRNEKLVRAYLYWTPLPEMAFSAEYLFEDLDCEAAMCAENIIEVTTHRIPLGLRYYHGSGLTAQLKGTYVNQQGEFYDIPSFAGDDKFWVVDASISYRLPKRFGLISLAAKNLFDQEFRFQDTDPKRPIIQPERIIYLRINLAF